MAELNPITGRLEAIEGLKEYAVVDKEGHVVAHRAEDPDTLGSAVALCALACEAIRAALGSSAFRYLTLGGPGGADLIILEAGGHFVGVSRAGNGKAGTTAGELYRQLSGQLAASPTD